MGGEVSTDFKSSNGMEISQLVQVLLNFDWFWGCPPLGGGGGWMWVGGGERVPLTHMHMHAHARARTRTHAHARARTHAYDIIGNSQGFPQWGQPFAWNYHVYHTCMCMRAGVCVRVHVCVGHPPNSPQPHTPTHPPPGPQGAQNTKIQ